jgi:hypothetical protein
MHISAHYTILACGGGLVTRGAGARLISCISVASVLLPNNDSRMPPSGATPPLRANIYAKVSVYDAMLVCLKYQQPQSKCACKVVVIAGGILHQGRVRATAGYGN